MQHTINVRGLDGWRTFEARDGSGACLTVDAVDMGLYRDDSIAQTFQPIGRNHPGYDPVCDCYCWGYRPRPVQLEGVPRGAVQGLGAIYATRWKVCQSSGYSSGRRCPCETECPDCPPQQPCPPSARRPAVAPLAPAAPALPGVPQKPAEKFGVSAGLVAAAVVASAAGYYGYKKGWFKRGRR